MHTGHSATDAPATTTSGTSTSQTGTDEVTPPVQIRRARHELALVGTVPPVVACPHCGGLVSTATAGEEGVDRRRIC